MKFMYNPPILIKKLFSDFIWETKNGKILLTFDDGPNPITTELILKKLSENNLQAIFFAVGENIKNHESLAKEILSEGHEIGNHSYNHKILTKINFEEREKQIQLTQQIAKEKLNYTPKYFRPSHGRFTLNLNSELKNYSLKNVMWNLLTYDYKNDFRLVKKSIDKYLTQKSIVVFHDSNKSADIIIDSIDYLVQSVENKGYKFGKVSECLN